MARGGKQPGAGRPKGVQNKVTAEFKVALNNLLELSAPKMADWLEQVAQTDPGKALDQLGRLAEYVHPKLARTETKIEGEITHRGLVIERSKD